SRDWSSDVCSSDLGRATQYDQLGSNRNLPFLNVGLPDVTHPTGKHDWLVVAAPFLAIRTCYFFLKGPEISAQVGTTEFVIECSTTQRALDHDIQGGNNTIRLAIVFFPGLLIAGDPQIGHGKTRQTSLGFGSSPGRALIANLTARASGSTRERRNCRGVV